MNSSAASPATMDRACTLAESREHCCRVAKLQAKNFYHGMKLVPQPKRDAMFTLYAWMREADDLADAAGNPSDKQRALDAFRRDTYAAVSPDVKLPDGPLWPAFRDMALTYNIPRPYFDAMIDGQLLDQTKVSYKTFPELYDYCYKVASVVGLCCIEIWGYEGWEETRRFAEWRGIAFQLTNILRDVLEDAQRGRVYLPADRFDMFEINPSIFTLGKADELLPGLKKLAAEAQSYYDKSAPLDSRVHPDGRACLWAMTEIYHSLLEKIRRDPSVVLRQRVRLSAFRKAWIAFRATTHKGGKP